MSKQISAVEWLAEQITTVKWKMSDVTDRNAIIEQAKQMEKEQIEKAYFTGSDRIGFCCYSDDYYNETYGTNK